MGQIRASRCDEVPFLIPPVVPTLYDAWVGVESYAFPASALRLRALPVEEGRTWTALPETAGRGSFFRRLGAGAPTGTRDEAPCPDASAATCALVRTPFV